MAGPGESGQDVAARDDAHLRSLGIKPELKRTLGFLSNFAIAFAFISVSTGTFGNYGVGFGLGGAGRSSGRGSIVIVGQSSSPSNFAELASHFPVAGSDLPVVEAAVATGRSAGSPAGSTSGPRS